MKQTRLLLLSALCMAVAGTSHATTTHVGHEHKHEQGAAAKTLQLNGMSQSDIPDLLQQLQHLRGLFS